MPKTKVPVAKKNKSPKPSNEKKPALLPKKPKLRGKDLALASVILSLKEDFMFKGAPGNEDCQGSFAAFLHELCPWLPIGGVLGATRPKGRFAGMKGDKIFSETRLVVQRVRIPPDQGEAQPGR